MNRGDIYWCELVSNNGDNIQKGIRPVVIIQNDIGNAVSPIVIVCPTTSKIEKLDSHIHMKISKNKYKINLDSIILVEQIQLVNKNRLGLKIDSLTDDDKYRLDLRIKYILELDKTNSFKEVSKLFTRLSEINGIIKYIHKYKLFSFFDFELLSERMQLLEKYDYLKREYSALSQDIENDIKEINILLKDFKEYYNHKKKANFV